jgi:APA family basic amino acid/polyamine antiporter
LAGIVLLVGLSGKGDISHFDSVPQEKALLPAISAVISLVLWTYDGWSDVGSVAGEVQNPQKSLPRVYLIGTIALVTLFLLANAAYFYALSIPEMRATDAVASSAVGKVLGGAGATAVGLIVMFSTLGSTHASIITGARVTFAQAQDGLLFSFLGRVHPQFQTPSVALWVQCLLSCIAVTALRGFQDLALGFVFTMWIFYGMAGATLFLLRSKDPDRPRPFRCPGYPVVPGLFVLGSGAMTVMQIIADWRGTLPWFGVLLLALPAFTIWKRFAPVPSGLAPPPSPPSPSA